jgi:hypothetical protein
MYNHHLKSSLEPLESRIAPAAVVVTYTDAAGDLVKIRDSSGHLTSADLTLVASGLGDQLTELNLSGAGFAGASITFSIVHKAGDNGLANVGYIDAGTNNLGNVVLKGDLGRIVAASGVSTTPAIKSLSVYSLGRLGLDSQEGLGSPSLTSTITGTLGSLTVTHDDDGAFINVTGGIGAVTIGGSLIGGSTSDSGEIFSSGNIGPVKIGGDILGGGGSNSGEINAGGTLASATVSGSVIGSSGPSSGYLHSQGNMGAVKIGGSLVGGAGTFAGEIFTNSGAIKSATISGSLIGGAGRASGYIGALGSATLGAVKIGGDVQGSSGEASGAIKSNGPLLSVTVTGSLVGGSGESTGDITSGGDMGSVKIGGDFLGGSISGTTGALSSSGLIQSGGNITSVAIGGSIIAGTNSSTASGAQLTSNASIRAGHELGSLKVGGSIVGNPDGGTGDTATPVVISAVGQATPVAPNDVAIGKITVGGNLEDAVILAGYSASLTPLNGNAQIGAVKVGGDWVASDLVAGATNSDLPSGAPFANYGNSSDALISGGVSTILSKIASITIGGQVIGTPNSVSTTDHFGFVAEAIGPVKIGGYAFSVASSTSPQPVGETGDVDIHIIT